jgi:DNA ligase (NAD+)
VKQLLCCMLTGLVHNYADLYTITVNKCYLGSYGTKSAENLVKGVGNSKVFRFGRDSVQPVSTLLGETVAKTCTALPYYYIVAKNFSSRFSLVDEIGERIAQSVVDFFSNEAARCADSRAFKRVRTCFF